MAVPQATAPVWQALTGVQAMAAPQATQAFPALQTMLVPQEAPAALLVALSTHTDEPVEHDVVPTLQGSGLVEQVSPAVHAVQVPALQTRLLPQVVPSARDIPLSVHTGAPVAHDRFPRWQALAGVQVPVTSQSSHTPMPLHTWPVPQVVPTGLLPTSTQTACPVVHDVAPVLQAFAG